MQEILTLNQQCLYIYSYSIIYRNREREWGCKSQIKAPLEMEEVIEIIMDIIVDPKKKGKRLPDWSKATEWMIHQNPKLWPVQRNRREKTERVENLVRAVFFFFSFPSRWILSSYSTFDRSRSSLWFIKTIIHKINMELISTSQICGVHTSDYKFPIWRTIELFLFSIWTSHSMIGFRW